MLPRCALCKRIHYAKGLCDRHYGQLRRGELSESDYVAAPIPARHSYESAHRRIRAERGRASGYSCTCGAQAAEWAYTNDDPDELIDPAGGSMRYSMDPRFYVPMCQPCHKKMDASVRAARRPKAGVS